MRDQIPSAVSIAKYHGLLREANSLAKATSAPLINLLWTPFYSLLLNTTVKNYIDLFYESLDEHLREFFKSELATNEKLNLIQIAYFFSISGLMLISMPVCMYLIFLSLYKIWHSAADLVVSWFPNGITFCKQKLAAKKTKDQLLNTKQVTKAITDLESHVTTLSIRRYIVFGITLAAFLLLPMTLTHFNLITPNFWLGDLTFQKFLSDLIFRQVFPFLPLQVGVSVWYYLRANSYIESFKTQLSKITLCNKWEIIQRSSVEKALYVLRLNPEATTQLRIGGKTVEVRNEDYEAQIHRLCLEANIPVYATGSGAIYVGYADLRLPQIAQLASNFSSRLWGYAQQLGRLVHAYFPFYYNSNSPYLYFFTNAMTQRGIDASAHLISSRLLSLDEKYRLEEDIKQQLVRLCEAHSIEEPTIHGYFDRNQRSNDRSFAFYIEKEDHARVDLNALTVALKQCYGAECVTDEPDRMIINIDYQQGMKAKAEQLLAQLASRKPAASPGPSLFSPVQSKTGKTKSQGSKGKKTEKKAIIATPTVRIPSIRWPNISLVPNRGESPQVITVDYNPDAKIDSSDPNSYRHKAFPLHVPWERNGTSFAYVDDRALDQAGHFLGMSGAEGRKRLVELFIRGAVDPMGVHKSKAGGVGINDTGGKPYNDVGGRHHFFSKYQAKIDNFGAYCEPADPQTQVVTVEGQRRVLYYFNGTNQRHS